MLLVLSAFFSSSETALMAINRYRLRHRASEGHKGARIALRLLEKPDRLIGIILLGNNLVNFIAVTVATFIAARLAGNLGIGLVPFVLTPIVLIFAEVAPKTWAAIRPESIGLPAARVLAPLLRLLYPVVWLVNTVANQLLKPFGLENDGQAHHLNRDELRTLVTESQGKLGERYQGMLVNILDLEGASVEDVMVPRNEMTAIDLDDDWEQIQRQITQSFYTRLPVIKGDFDQVIGILHVRTVIHRLARGTLTANTLSAAVRKPYYIPETTALTQQLLEFQERERRMGLVVDEYGDIQGLLTLDDILEEIVGEFTTEPRPRSRRVSRRHDGVFIVDGAESVRSLNRRLGWSLPTEGARTVNGLLLEQLETIPEAGTKAIINGLELTITQIEDNLIRTIEVSPVDDDQHDILGK